MIGKIILIFIISLYSLHLLAVPFVKIELNPRNPIVNKSFNLKITIGNVESESLPFISFDPRNIRVLDKINSGVTKSQKLKNGKIIILRKHIYIYKLLTRTSGVNTLYNLKVIQDTIAIYNRNYYQINVLSNEKKHKDIFLEAEIDKSEIFLGEGVNVNYFIYSRYNVSRQDYLHFPKFKNWMKRYMDIKVSTQIVKLNNRMYKKIRVYSTRLFPLKTGKLFIDNIRLKLTIPRSQIGLNNRVREDHRTVRSNNLTVNVKELPLKIVPKNFSGLVGSFQLNYKINKTKFLKNEILEIFLTIKGDGQLESFKAPVLFDSELIEVFDQQETLTNVKKIPIKTIRYTFFCRKPGLIPSKDFKLSFFNEQTKSLYTKSFTLPAITIASVSQNIITNENKNKKESFKSRKTEIFKAVVPDFINQNVNDFYLNLNIVLYTFVLFLLIVIFPYSLFRNKTNPLLLTIFKDGINYKLLRLYLQGLQNERLENDQTNLTSLINSIKISENESRYLMELYGKCLDEYKNSDTKTKKISVNKSMLKSILKKCREKINEQ